MPRAARIVLIVLCTPLLAAGCGDGGASAMLRDDAGDSLTFSIAGRSFHVASAAARVASGILGLHFTDQPDACLAVTQVPAGDSAIFSLRVNPQADGATRADVIAPQPFTQPAAGQAMGKLFWQTGGAVSTSLETINGSVTWTVNGGGSVDVSRLDVGFTGVADRIGISGLHLSLCP